MTSSLVGSEMCIRDRDPAGHHCGVEPAGGGGEGGSHAPDADPYGGGPGPVSYTHLTLPTICSV
eukprot:10919043-Prorocentrum_lima.AAC.1